MWVFCMVSVGLILWLVNVCMINECCGWLCVFFGVIWFLLISVWINVLFLVICVSLLLCSR